VILYNYITFTV